MKNNDKLFILALDGTPYSLLKRMFSLGLMPNLNSLINENNFKSMNSVVPPISSVAWASFLTGENPSGHNIYGFIERDPASMEVYVPTSLDLRRKTIYHYASEAGKKVFTMNVPITYPPFEINGVMICGFLGTDVLKGTYPAQVGRELADAGYVIDIDTVRARDDLNWFIEELNVVLKKRFETMWKFFRRENWDLFFAHIMETDRLHHFVWEYMENGDAYWTERFFDIYRKIDVEIGKILNELPAGMQLMVLSDHGFTTLKKEVFINKYLFDNNFLKFNSTNPPQSLHDIHPQSLAYSLIPGRIYINLKGREKGGSVAPGMEYERTREELRQRLEAITDPVSGEKVVAAVKTREELYDPGNLAGANSISRIFEQGDPFYLAPDLTVLNAKGYDFKGNLWKEHLFEKGPIVGTHTFDDAFILLKDGRLPDNGQLNITDGFGIIAEILGLEIENNK